MFPPAPAPPAAPASNVEAVKVETKPPAPAVKPPEAPKLAIPPMKYEPEDKEVSSDEEVKPRRRKKPVPAYPFPRLPTQPMPGYTPRAAMPDDAIVSSSYRTQVIRADAQSIFAAHTAETGRLCSRRKAAHSRFRNQASADVFRHVSYQTSLFTLLSQW